VDAGTFAPNRQLVASLTWKVKKQASTKEKSKKETAINTTVKDVMSTHVIAKELIVGTFLCDPDRFTVTVNDGIVTIKGAPETTTAGLDIIDAARHMEGVVAMRDRLSYPHDSPYRPPVPS
jgi:osmotically-inducible protein OsmY